jgi:3-hydroxyacyl-[acyl-carrier-protein] dehydratase
VLIDNLFDINPIQQIEDKLITEVTINASNSIFDGHFPGNPVTPGVIQIQLAKEVLEKYYDRTINLDSIARCKFLAVLNPVESPTITVEITVKEIDNTLKINAVGKDDSTSYFKFSAVYS